MTNLKTTPESPINDQKEHVHSLKRSLRISKDELESFERQKQNILNNIAQLKNEKKLMYHINQTFKNVYGPIQKTESDYGRIIDAIMLPWEIGRLVIAYGLFPITVPFAAAYAATEWRSKKDNAAKITQQEIALQKTVDHIKEIQTKISDLENRIIVVTD